jgi:hypothetical protein
MKYPFDEWVKNKRNRSQGAVVRVQLSGNIRLHLIKHHALRAQDS